MESYGAVFLLAAGRRDGTDVDGVDGVGSGGYYWSSSALDDYGAGCLYFYSNDVYKNYGNRSGGQSVRLVQDAK